MPLPSTKTVQPKSAGELMTDPHFLFTMFSLLASVCVFFYYLYQLLFRTSDWRTGETYTPNSSQRKNSGAKAIAAAAPTGGAAAAAGGSDAANTNPSSAQKKKRVSMLDSPASSAPPTPSKSSLGDSGIGGHPDSSATTPKRRISQSELVAEMEKKIEELKRRGDLRKQLLKEVIEETLAAAEDIEDDDDATTATAAASSGRAESPPQQPTIASDVKQEDVKEGDSDSDEVHATKEVRVVPLTVGDMTQPTRFVPGGELRRRRTAARED